MRDLNSNANLKSSTDSMAQPHFATSTMRLRPAFPVFLAIWVVTSDLSRPRVDPSCSPPRAVPYSSRSLGLALRISRGYPLRRVEY
jgi:hypothetical protein